MISLPSELKRLLDGAARRIRWILVLRGLVVTGAAFLALALLAMAADAFCVIFDDRIRSALAAVLWGATALVAFLVVIRPWFRPVSRRKVARVLDERHPEVEERFSTIVDLVEADGKSASAISEGLFRKLAREGVICANRIDLKREFTARTIYRRLVCLGAALALLLASFLVFPNLAGLLFVRVAFPWVDVGNIYSDYLAVTPGSVVVLKGTTVEIKASLTREIPGEMTIRISRRDGRGWGPEYAEPLPAEGYRELADLKQREWRYRVSCGPAVSRYYTVRVCEMPRYRAFTATLRYPAYAERPDRAFTNEQVGAIQALAGTRVTFRLEIDEKGTTGELRLKDGHAVRLSDDGTLVGEMVSNRVASWSMQMTNADGFKSPARGGPFVSVPDQPPQVVIERPQKTLRLAPHAKLPVEYTANDDIGLGDIVTRCATDDNDFFPLYRDEFAGHPALAHGVKDIDLSRLDLESARRVRFDFIVTDRYPEKLGGPHAVTSTPVTVEFDVQAKSFEEQDLEARMKESFDSFHEAEKRLGDAANRARDAKGEADRNRGEITDRAEKQIEEMAHEVAESEKRAEELADALERDGRFDPIAEELRDIAEKELAPVKKKVEEAQFASAEKRVEALDRVQPMLREAQEKMRKTEEELKKRREKVATFERMKDLSERQEALAAAAEKITEERPVETKKLEAWKKLEEAAARLANDVSRPSDSDAVDLARREMEYAAEKMKALREEIEREAKACETKQQKEQAEKAREAAQAREAANRKNARENAQREAARAEDLLKKAAEKAQAAAQEKDANQRAQRNREADALSNQARDAMRNAAGALVRAEAPQETLEHEKKALEAVRDSRQAASDRAADLKRALAEQREVTKDLERMKTAEDAKPETGDQGADAKAQASDAHRETPEEKKAREAAREAARAELAKAEKAAADALHALQRRDPDAAAKADAEAKADVAAARAKFPANGLDKAESSLAEAARKVEEATHRKNDEGHLRYTADRQREALKDLKALSDALAEASGEDMSVWRAKRRAEDRAERRLAAEAEAFRAEKRAEEAEKRNDRGGAERERRAAAAATDRAEGLKGLDEELACADEGENREPRGECGDGEAEPKKARGAVTPDAVARKAAEDLADAVSDRAAELGIEMSEVPDAAPDAKSEQSPSSTTAEISPSGGKGGVAKVLKELDQELKKNGASDSIRSAVSRRAWFRIRGTVKEGLGEGSLKDIPPDYRDLVRRYFLRLVTEPRQP